MGTKIPEENVMKIIEAITIKVVAKLKGLIIKKQ